MSTRIPLLFGTMTLGFQGTNGTRVSSKEECQEIIDVFFSHGHSELDTARVYGEGTTEQMLSQLNLGNAVIDTKVWPYKPGDHAPENLRKTFLSSLSCLKRDKVRVFYLHGPDRSVPFEDTLREVNALYQEGRFEILGLSNFMAWEVAQVVGICKANNYVLPKIYQAMYNAITRVIETELVPCCRYYGLRVVIYNPLCGGLFAGKAVSADDPTLDVGRFNTSMPQGRLYRARYVNDGYFKAIELVKSVAEKHNLRLTEVALRWCQHHSVLTPNDGIILGASSKAQLEQNCDDSEKGPLPKDVVEALDEADKIVKAHGCCPPYWR